VPGPSWTHRKWRKCFQTCHNRWWIVDFRVWSRIQTTNFRVAHEQLTVPEESKNEQSKTKSMLICFFDSQGTIHKEFVLQGQTVNKQCYHEVLERLRERVHRVRPEIADTWILDHDNAPCHTAISVNEYFTKNGMPVVSKPPYSPDVSPYDFFLFPKLKFHLKGRHFGNADNIQQVVADQFKALPHEDMKNSSVVTGSGNNVSGGVWLPRGTTLKGIMLICSSVVNKKIYSTSLFTF